MRKELHPYPGLRAFERSESRVFFGRQQQIDDLLTRLKQHHFLAVVGTSGSGKSSLIKAGLLPALAKGYMGEVGANWTIAEMRPGDQPFNHLAEALLADALAADKAFTTAWDNPSFLAAALRRGSRSLQAILADNPLPTGTRLLILVDQFEEIFRFQIHQEEQASAFVALLLEACQHKDIYVVLTMRSDFLGNAAQFPNLPEAINNGLYLTPRLTREQLAEAIRNPARLFGGSVDESLINHLLNEVGNHPDQLPLLQHALMLLWEDNKNDGKTLSLENYRELDGLHGALNGHAEQAWKELDENGKYIAKIIFSALTESSREGQDIRRPVKIQALLELTGVDLARLTDVIHVFRQSGRNFLMPPQPVELTAETILDIVHESLIRQWQRLQSWVKEEGKKAAMYQRLVEAAHRHATGQGELWHGIDLAIAQEWKTNHQPNKAWAERYSQTGDFDLAIQFFTESENKQKEQQQIEKAQQEKQVKQMRRQYMFAFAGFLIVTALSIWGLIERNQRAQVEIEIAEAQADIAEAAVLKAVAEKNKEDDIYKQAIAKDPKNPEHYMDYARFLKNIRKDKQKAKAYYEMAINADPKNARNLADIASIMEEDFKGYDQAEKLYKKSLEIKPNDADTLSNFAWFMESKRKDYDQAEKFYKKALEIDLNHTLALLFYADFLENIRKDYDQLEKLYKKAITENSKNPEYYMDYARFLKNIRKDKQNAKAYYKMAYYKMAINVDPKNVSNLADIAVIMKNDFKDYDQAEKLYKKALEIEPDDVNTLGNFADFMSDIRKDYDQAEKLYKKALEIEPDDVNTLGNFANFMSDIRKDYDQAEKLYKKALAIEPDHANTLGNFANFMSDIRKDYDQAEKLYKKALEIEPDDVNTLGNFANFMSDIRKGYDQAEKLYKKALEIEPDDVNTLGNFAKLKLVQGDYKSGKKLIDQAFSSDSIHPTLELELWFYRYAHFYKDYPQASKEVIALLKAGERSVGWDLSANIERAKQDGHPNLPFLQALADVLSDKAKFDILTPYLKTLKN